MHFYGVLACFLAGYAAVTIPITVGQVAAQLQKQERLAVVVPAYLAEFESALASLGRWPGICSSNVRQNIGVVLYYAAGSDDASTVDDSTEVVVDTGAVRCLLKTVPFHAHADDEVRQHFVLMCLYFSEKPLRCCCGIFKESPEKYIAYYLLPELSVTGLAWSSPNWLK